MNKITNNTDLLHEVGAIDRHQLSEENIQVINNFSQDEIQALKASHQGSKELGRTAGISF